MTFGASPIDSATSRGRRTSGCILPRPPSLASISVSLPSSSTLTSFGGTSISYRSLQVSAVLRSISTVFRKVLKASAISLQFERFSSTSFLSNVSSSAIQCRGRCRVFFNGEVGRVFFSLLGFPSGTNRSKKYSATDGVVIRGHSLT